MASNPRTIQLWRRCLRCCKAMDGAMGNYYHGFAREHIVAHREEDDPERLEHLLDRGEQNLRFVLRKYRMAEPRPPEPPATTTSTTKKMRRRRVAATPRTTEIDKGKAGGSGRGSSSGDSSWTPGR
ncbi:unnamed protein product [Hapterophycus canaliculatus]